MISPGTAFLIALMLLAFTAAAVLSLIAVALLVVMLFGRMIERAFTPPLWRRDGNG